MTPTARCAALLSLLALTALVLPAPLVGAGALALAAATVVDGLSVRRSPRIERTVGAALARGVPARFSITALTRDRRRVLLRQPSAPGLVVDSRAGAQGLEGEITALRRGRHALPGVAAASVGPLGLARWHHRAGAPSGLLVYPDLPTARRLALQLRQGRAAPEGRLRRGPLGVGTDFESIRDYSPDDDIRHVNWRASARLGRPMTNQYRVEQDRDVILLLDTGRLMTAPAAGAIASGDLLDAALDAGAAVAVAADELGDHCGAIAFDAEVHRVIEPRRLGGRQVVGSLFDLQARMRDSDFERAVLRVGGSRRAFVLIFTDLIEEQAARSLLQAAPMLAKRHAVVVAGVADPQLGELAAGACEDGNLLAGARASEARRVAEARALAASSVIEARERTALRLRRAGADVVLAPTRSLPGRCVQAYLRAKARARL